MQRTTKVPYEVIRAPDGTLVGGLGGLVLSLH